MARNGFDEARALYSALMDCFVDYSGGTADARALARVEQLCDAAIRAVDDLECRVSVRTVQGYARLLFSEDGHKGLQAGSLHGVELLRFRIFNALSDFRGRLNAIELRRLPQPELPALTEEPAFAAPAAKPLRILVVEDNADAAESLRRLLELCGYDVTVAATGHEGLQAARRISPHVVLLDIGLPDTDGFAVAAALRQDPHTSAARLIAVTGYGQEHERRRAAQAGIHLHLLKPVNPQTLLRELGG